MLVFLPPVRFSVSLASVDSFMQSCHAMLLAHMKLRLLEHGRMLNKDLQKLDQTTAYANMFLHF